MNSWLRLIVFLFSLSVFISMDVLFILGLGKRCYIVFHCIPNDGCFFLHTRMMDTCSKEGKIMLFTLFMSHYVATSCIQMDYWSCYMSGARKYLNINLVIPVVSDSSVLPETLALCSHTYNIS